MKEYKLKINGSEYNVSIDEVEENSAKIQVNGSPFTVEFEKPITKKAAKPAVSVNRPAPSVSAPAAPVAKPAASSTGGNAVTSPLPGVILEVNVAVGDSVTAGQKVMVLEAMKMENVIEATAAGTVKAIKVNKGDSVLEGAELLVIG
ncbi:MAG: acetyl-CoA carboxylase biotin carboxyl carrier protein subunit [Bacteroidales bacterium]|nr:acetyl-CoA carboxylase biotin carboxyl carrier protein subunit [Bacteroidales bacterium]